MIPLPLYTPCQNTTQGEEKMGNKSQSTVSTAPAFSICSITAAFQLRAEISTLFKRLFVGESKTFVRRGWEMLQYGLTTLLITAIFLACGWLFLIQLAEHGWGG